MTSSEADGPDILVLSRLGGFSVPGSTRITAGCGCACWISPSGATLLGNRPDIETRCVTCAKVTLATLASPEVESIPGSFAEVSDVLGAEVAGDFFAKHGLSRE